MSYSLICDCPVCRKRNNCTDMVFIQAALNGIHSVNYDPVGAQRNLHLGAGSIEMQCQNLDDERQSIPVEQPECCNK